MTGLLKFLIPKDVFFPLFEKATSNLVEIAKTLHHAAHTADAEKRKEYYREIERLEHVGDTLTHEILNELGKTFITPFDREDIHELTSKVDDIADYIHGASKRIELYKIEKIIPPIQKLTELILMASEELDKAIHALRNLKNAGKIREACVKINSIENHADDIFDLAVARLFEEEKNAVELIKAKEILSSLETATDRCEDVANALENILIKAT